MKNKILIALILATVVLFGCTTQAPTTQQPAPIPEPPIPTLVQPAFPTPFATTMSNRLTNANFLSNLMNWGYFSSANPVWDATGALDAGSLVLSPSTVKNFWQGIPMTLKAGDKILVRSAIKAEEGYSGSGGYIQLQLKPQPSTGVYTTCSSCYHSSATSKSTDWQFRDVVYTVTADDVLKGNTYPLVAGGVGWSDSGKVHFDNIQFYIVTS